MTDTKKEKEAREAYEKEKAVTPWRATEPKPAAGSNDKR